MLEGSRLQFSDGQIVILRGYPKDAINSSAIREGAFWISIYVNSSIIGSGTKNQSCFCLIRYSRISSYSGHRNYKKIHQPGKWENMF